MTEERSPWARPDLGQADPAGWVLQPPPQPQPQPAAVRPATVRPARTAATPTVAGPVPGTPASPAGYRAGTVTRHPGPRTVQPVSGHAAAWPGAEPDLDDPARRNKIMLRWFGGGAAAVVVIGLVALLAIMLTGNAPTIGPAAKRAEGPADTRSDLAKLCPPPTGDAAQGQAAPPAPPGPRTVDQKSGISYKAYGEPWQPWTDRWSQGTLRVVYGTGQYFVTERYGSSGSEYLASILSGAVPAATNDAMTLDLECTGRQVVADVQAEYYPRPNTVEMLRDEQAFLGGRPAWVSIFRMRFDAPGLKAKDELVGVALIDVGRPEAAILYVSVPGTHRQYEHVVEEVLDSVRPV